MSGSRGPDVVIGAYEHHHSCWICKPYIEVKFSYYYRRKEYTILKNHLEEDPQGKDLWADGKLNVKTQKKYIGVDSASESNMEYNYEWVRNVGGAKYHIG